MLGQPVKQYKTISFSSYNLERWHDDLKCGPRHPLNNSLYSNGWSQPSECDPNNFGYQCCSAPVDDPWEFGGRCGNDCSCSGCIDYRVQGEFKKIYKQKKICVNT